MTRLSVFLCVLLYSLDTSDGRSEKYVDTDLDDIESLLTRLLQGGATRRTSGRLQPRQMVGDPCVGGAQYNAEEGQIATPGYPGNYGNNMECTWIITVPEGQTLTLTFNENFNIEGRTGRCYDVLDVFDGVEGPRLGSNCGRTVPDPYTTTGNSIKLRFTSDRGSGKAGFSATFKANPGAGAEIENGGEKENDDKGENVGGAESGGQGEHVGDGVTGGEGGNVGETESGGEGDDVGDAESGGEGDSVSDADSGDEEENVDNTESVGESENVGGAESGGEGENVGDTESGGNADNIPSDSIRPVPTLASVSMCGVPAITPSFNRVVGGQEARPNSWPWQVFIRLYHNRGYHICGGSIINENWILTAAHCIVDRVAAAPDIKVTVGDHNVYRPNQYKVKVNIAEFLIHPEYNGEKGAFQFNNDVCLLRTTQPIVFNDAVSPICLPRAPAKDGDMCVLTGWGATLDGKSRSIPMLQQAVIPVISRNACLKSYWTFMLSHNMFCAGGRNKYSCNGDSGGPLACTSTASGAYVLQGVVSFGYTGCPRGKPTVYAQVNNYLSWIQETTGAQFNTM